jgi:hypothetical protein
MNMKIIRLSSLLFAFALAGSAFCFDFPALAGKTTNQNANSSTTTMAENSNAGKSSRGRGRRGRRRAAPSATETATTPADQSSTVPAGPTEQTDLSGTYTGTFNCSDAGVNGETTLTITGNQFTLSDGKAGRIVAATTSGYTGVAMQFGELTIGTTKQPGSSPTIVSMRAKKSGNRLTLTTVPGASHVCSFTPTGASSRGSTRHRKARTTTPAAAEPATPAEPMATPATPPASAGPEPPATPTPRPRGRRGGRVNQNTNSNTNANDNTGARPTPTPVGPRN